MELEWFRYLARAAHQVDQTARAQKRREIRHRAVDLQRFVVKRRKEARRRHPLTGRDFVDQHPEGCFELNARRMPADAQGTVDGPVALRVLARKDLTHGISSSLVFMRRLCGATCAWSNHPSLSENTKNPSSETPEMKISVR